jgi:hypothetical protein
VSTGTPEIEIVEIRGDLRLVTLDGLPEGTVGAALADAHGTEIERITAPATQFDADAVFRRLDTRRQELVAHLERLRVALARGPDPSILAVLRELGWRLPGVAWTALPLVAGLVQAEFLARGGWGDDTIIFMGVEAFLLMVALGVVADLPPRPGFGLLALLYTGSLAAGLIMFVMGVTALGRLWPVLNYSVIAAFVTLVGATFAQLLIAWWRYHRALPYPGVWPVDLSAEPAASPAEPLLCVARYGGRPVPCLAVRHRTEAGDPALYTLLPLRRLRRSSAAAIRTLASRALDHAAYEQRDARLAAEARTRLGELEKSMRELD